MLYLDNAAGSFPKPRSVSHAMAQAHTLYGANPGRGNYALTRRTAQMVEEARTRLAHLVNAPHPQRMVFTSGATMSLNMAIRGLLQPGSHVLTSSMEHNAVMRPLAELEDKGIITLDIIPADRCGYINTADVAAGIRPETALLAFSHASNVCGSVQPIAALGQVAKQHNIPLLVDAAQSAGLLPIDVQAMNISLLALAGHKALYGPSGIGALYVAEGIRLAPLVSGGTGGQSELRHMPEDYPMHLEAGSLNTAGIAGWLAGLDFVESCGVEALHSRGMQLIRLLEQELREMPHICLQHEAGETRPRVPLLSFTVEGMTANEAAAALDEAGICVRAGYHCAPWAHRTLGTFAEGTVRISPGWYNTAAEMLLAADILHGLGR